MRKWLNKNKIFFDILTTLSLVFIAVQANIISKTQVENNEITLQPSFFIQKLENNNVVINHDNNKFTNLELTVSSILFYSFTTGNTMYFPEDLIVEDNFRYITDFKYSEEIELDLIIESDSIFKASKQSLKDYFETQYEEKVEIGNHKLMTYLELAYFDFKGKRQTLYYDITRNPRRIPEQMASRVFNQGYNMIYLDLMEPEFLEDIFYRREYYDENGRRIRFTEGIK